MALVAWGYLVVALDLNIGGFDVVVDFAGWAACLTGLGRVEQHSRWFGYAIHGSLVGALVSIPQAFAVDTGRVGAVAIAVAMLVLVFGTCSGIIESVRNARIESTAIAIRWWTLAIDGIAIAVLAAGGPGFGVGVPEAVLLVIPGLAVTIWFIVFLFRVQDEVEMVTTH